MLWVSTLCAALKSWVQPVCKSCACVKFRGRDFPFAVHLFGAVATFKLRPPDPVNLAPPVSKPSYAEMAKGGVGIQPNFSPRAYNKSFQSVLMGEKTPIVKDTSSEKFQNAPAAIFYDDEVDALAAPLQRTLVGKFNRMPRFERDWFFGGYKMRVLKWSVDFVPEKESSIVPVWITFPNLRYHLYEGSALLNLAKSLGPPIQMDEATAKGTRPSKARVCIEFDCLVEPPTEIWVQIASNNNLKTAAEGGKKNNKEEWVEVRHKKAAHKHVENNAKSNPIPPLDKGKSIQIPILLNEGTSTKTHDREDVRDTPLGNLIEEEIVNWIRMILSLRQVIHRNDNHPILVDDAKTQDREIGKETPTDSTKSLTSDGMSIEFENHPRILTRRNSERDVQSHFSKKDLGKRNLRAEFNETAIAKNLRSERRILWDELCEVASSLMGVVVGGDFNAVLNVNESKGGVILIRDRWRNW
uniref:Uncharacterized protein n=1 Tax=Salix viminalis TaxID=40686 RepID=A0A6N2LLT6_SALVM